ncbi:radical SAM protein [Streptomyces sp. NPDC001393]
MSHTPLVPHGLPMERDAGPFDPPRDITRLREARPVSPMVFPDGHEGWLVTGYDAVRQLLADTRFSSRQDIGVLHVPYEVPGTPAATEPSPQIRIRRPEQVVHDMAALAAKHGSDSFMFVDEIMTLTSLRGVSRELNDGGHELYWYGETRFSKGLDDELAAALRRSGCRRLDLGLESYNQRVLDLMRKGTKVDDIEPSLKALLGNKVPVHLFCMTGFPGETEEEALRTQEFAAKALRRSVEEFGVPYSTAANGPFILDVLSPVGERPDLFGVELIPPDEGEDLAFDLDYTVSTGLSRQDAARLTSGGPGGPAVGAAFHRGTWIGDAEEWSFLWALAEAELPARRVAVPAAPCPEVGRAATVRLANGVRGRVSVTGRGVLLHVPSCDALLDVPEEWRPLLDGRDHALADLWRDIPSPRAAAATLARLASHGALSVEQGSPGEELACVWYAAQPHLVRDSGTDGSCLLVSPETGRGVRVSAAGRLLWLLAADGATDAELAERSRLPERQRRLLLENLAEHRVIASAALAPGLLELPRVAA